MDLTPAELRHGIRGTLNALKLCVSALEMPLDTSEKVEFLADIESSADKMMRQVEQFLELTTEPAEQLAAHANVR